MARHSGSGYDYVDLGVPTLQSGTLFRHTCARHWLVADSLEMG